MSSGEERLDETLAQLLPCKQQFTALERILLTANGNVQRILSAYYNSKVTVVVHKNQEVSERRSDVTVFDRVVDLDCKGTRLCRATSRVELGKDSPFHGLVMDGERPVGIGQLFRKFDILPEFQLLQAGREDDGGVWREYLLRSSGVLCRIRETFSPRVFS